jgi:excisionase family DNA binding protein
MDSDFIRQNPRFYSPEDLAVYLGVSKTTIYRLVEKRVIPFYKIGGSLRFKENDVNEYVEKQRVKSSGELHYERT